MSSISYSNIIFYKSDNIKLSTSIDAALQIKGDIQKEQGGFLIDEAEISLSALYKNKFKAHISLDFSKPNSSSKNTYTEPLDKIYLQLKRNNYLKFRAGQFKVPFGYENFLSSKERSTISHIQTTKKLSPDLDRGFMFFGNNILKYINYNIGIFNGVSVEQSLNSPSGLIAARLYTSRGEKINLKAGYSTYLRIQIPYSGDNEYRFSEGLYFKLKLKISEKTNWQFLTEYMEQLNFNNLNQNSYRWKRGVLIVTSIKIKNTEPTLFMDIYNDDTMIETAEKRVLGGGVNYHIIKNKVILKFNLQFEEDNYENNLIGKLNFEGHL